MPGPDAALIDAIRGSLEVAGDAERAVAQRAYMKSEMPYRGVAAAELKALLRPLFVRHAPTSRGTWDATIRELWDGASFREERYAATALARHRSARQWLDPESLDLWRHLILTGAWWDHVDDIATHLVGEVLVAHRAAVTPVILDWAVDPDLWIRRSAVICQTGRRDDTDVPLLTSVVEANLDDRTFWLRKAIGWAMRDYSATDPALVLRLVEQWGDRMSDLSRREAVRNIGRTKR